MGVKTTTVRNLVVGNVGLDTITVADLEKLITGLSPETEVDLTVYTSQPDRPYESATTRVTFEIEAGE